MKTKLQNAKNAFAALAALIAVTAATVPDASADTYRTGSVCAHSQTTWTFTLSAGRPVDIWVDGDGDTDLDIFLYDENGNLIDSDTDRSDTCLVEVRPKWTGKFTLVIQNLGPVYNRYSLVIDD